MDIESLIKKHGGTPDYEALAKKAGGKLSLEKMAKKAGAKRQYVDENQIVKDVLAQIPKAETKVIEKTIIQPEKTIVQVEHIDNSAFEKKLKKHEDAIKDINKNLTIKSHSSASYGGEVDKLSQLVGDVKITNVANAQILTYNSTSGKWENSVGGFLTKAQADTYYYPLSTNPAGYLTSATAPGAFLWQRNSTTLSPAIVGDNIETSGKFVVTGGFSTQFLKADGSLDGSTYITNISGQDLSTADNTTSAFITIGDLPASLWIEASGTLSPATVTNRVLLGGIVDDTLTTLQAVAKPLDIFIIDNVGQSPDNHGIYYLQAGLHNGKPYWEQDIHNFFIWWDGSQYYCTTSLDDYASGFFLGSGNTPNGDWFNVSDCNYAFSISYQITAIRTEGDIVTDFQLNSDNVQTNVVNAATKVSTPSFEVKSSVYGLDPFTLSAGYSMYWLAGMNTRTIVGFGTYGMFTIGLPYDTDYDVEYRQEAFGVYASDYLYTNYPGWAFFQHPNHSDVDGLVPGGMVIEEQGGGAVLGRLLLRQINVGDANNNAVINTTGLPSGTLLSPPGGLNVGDFWADTTTSAQYPIIRMRAS